MADEECKQEECPPGSPLWMCTFADLMSLLLCFFVLLLSFAVMDAKQYKQVAGAMKDAFGVQVDTPVSAAKKGNEMVASSFESVPLQVQIKIAKVFGRESESGHIQTDYTPQGLIIRVKGQLAFDPGSARIKKSFYPLLDKLGRLAEKADLIVEVSGHTDNTPVSKQSGFSSNWGLSAARAVAVVEYWRKTRNIPPQRLAAVGHGFGQPIASNRTEEGRRKNRRVEFKIRPGGPQLVSDSFSLDD